MNGRRRGARTEGTERNGGHGGLWGNGAEFKAPIEHAGAHFTAHLKDSSLIPGDWRDQRNRIYLTEQGRFCFVCFPLTWNYG
jgi:hypothetical protein